MTLDLTHRPGWNYLATVVDRERNRSLRGDEYGLEFGIRITSGCSGIPIRHVEWRRWVIGGRRESGALTDD
jgi:hypothetical protein